MRRRVHKAVHNMPAIRAVAVRGPVKLVTLEDPNAPPTLAQDAFARLRPPEGTSPDAVASWREGVAKVARAVKVLPSLRGDDVPNASTRVDVDEKVGSIREEAMGLAEETKNPHVVALVKRLLDEVGA